MATRPIDPYFRFPDLIALPADPDRKSEQEFRPPLPDNGLGVLRGLGFALLFEAVLGFSGWQLWRLLR